MDILNIIDADAGSVDQANGTITWSIDEFEVGQSQTFTVIAEVLPTAFLDTADQLFANSVSITDDNANGADPTPDNNEASESDMLLAGAGEPLFLLAVPENIALPPVSTGFATEFVRSPDKEVPNTARILTTDFMNGRDEGEETRRRIAENDILSGGDLLDEFSLRAPEIHCAPHLVSYDYHSDPATLELLDWLQESPVEIPASDDSDSDDSDSGDRDSRDEQSLDADATTGAGDAEALPAQGSEAEPLASTLQQQIQREAENLYGAGKEELLEAFKDSV